MKKTKELLFLTISILLLLLFMGGRFIINEKKDLTWYDVTFTIYNDNNSYDIRLWHNYYDDQNYLFLPPFLKNGSGYLTSVSAGYSKVWDNDVIFKGNAGADIDLTEGDHTLKIGKTEFDLNIMRSEILPVLFIDTSSGSLNYVEQEKGNGESAVYKYVDSDGNVIAEGTLDKIKTRGNATFLEDKKPYQINLNEASDLLGSGHKDKYVLLANRQDPSLIRNTIMYSLADKIGLSYSPRSKFIDLYINSDYRGVYQLCEKVEAGPYGIDINIESGRSDTDYLLTLEYSNEDRLEAEKYIIKTEADQYASVKSPEKPTKTQLEYITEQFNELQKNIKEGNIDKETVDQDSFAKKYIIEEFAKNLDAMHASQYFYSQNGIIKAGPIWDHDKTLGNPLIEHNRPVDFQEPVGIYAATIQNGAGWWYDLYNIPEFRHLVSDIYQRDMIPAVEHMLYNEIDSIKDEIWKSAEMEYVRWDTFEDQKYGIEQGFKSGFEEQLDIIKNFMEERKEFLSDIWLQNKKYNIISCDPLEGTMYVRYIDAVEGKKLKEPRKPELEGYKFNGWIREDTGELYDFNTAYDGKEFSLTAKYTRE